MTVESASETALLTELQQQALRAAEPLLWTNPALSSGASVPAAAQALVGHAAVLEAQTRFRRFAPLLQRLFPELQSSDGVIESPLLPAPHLQQQLDLAPAQGSLWIKADHRLSLAGSIKARGGFHEVLQFAEQVALNEGLIAPHSDYALLAEPAARTRLAQYEVAVGSTGNLGLSIGVISRALGFKATVHMSRDAKGWKKERLRDIGVTVIEHEGDYEQAVAQGRREAQANPRCHFVDDEHSLSLFCGYAAAALHLSQQLLQAQIPVDATHPLFVYLPCGVGGAPGGITYGLKLMFGPHVHCFFAEPVQAPCFLLQMATSNAANPHPSVYDFGLNNRTEADGLAVPKASLLAQQIVRELISGVYTVRDEALMRGVLAAHESEQLENEGLRIEPSAAAGFYGPQLLLESDEGQAYLHSKGLAPVLPQATHLAWTTGGLFVPDAEFDGFLQRGRQSRA